MSKIPRYNRLFPHTDLGHDAELTINDSIWCVANMSFKEMLTTYEPEIRTAEKAVLSSSEIGTWNYNYDSKKWERM